MQASCTVHILYFKSLLDGEKKKKRGCLHKFILQRRERFSIAERKALAWELATEIILEFDVILLKCDYHMGDMLREKF